MPRLQDVAGWPIPAQQDDGNTLSAGVPSLQRGLVWRPHQVEMFWDSILRGFPVGSFVVCKNFGDRYTSYRVAAEGPVTHHLLDGQQRAQAIKLGFQAPRFDCSADARQILWIDLRPTFPEESTRSYLLRLTTKAHPWGYGPDDEAKRLSRSDIVKLLTKAGYGEELFARPQPNCAWPSRAEAPVPLAWLLNNAITDFGDFWSQIRQLCDEVPSAPTPANRAWTGKVAEFLAKQPSRDPHLEKIWKGIRCALRSRVICLELQDDPMPDVAHVEDNATSEASRVTNAEHLFNRRNTGGTPLDGDELSWSLIKAHTPELEKPINYLSVSAKIPASRLATLSARVPLTGSRAITRSFSVSDFRRLAQEHSRSAGIQTGGDPVTRFLTDNGATGLRSVVSRVNVWLEYKGLSNDCLGLPPVLQGSIARTSTGHLYALLFWLAHCTLRSSSNGDEEAIGLRKSILALTTAIHWFGADNKSRIVNSLEIILRKFMKENAGILHPTAFFQILRRAEELVRLQDPSKSGTYMPLSSEEFKVCLEMRGGDLSSWTWWKLAERERPEEPGQLWARLNPIVYGREFLLYSQRSYLTEKFGDYDPADRDTWAEHDRPWDYDHILPKEKIDGRRTAVAHKTAVKEWLSTNGNMRAWDVGENRGYQASSPGHKLRSHGDMLRSLVAGPERDTFELAFGSIDTARGCELFIDASRRRLLRMHCSWYGPDGLDIPQIL